MEGAPTTGGGIIGLSSILVVDPVHGKVIQDLCMMARGPNVSGDDP